MNGNRHISSLSPGMYNSAGKSIFPVFPEKIRHRGRDGGVQCGCGRGERDSPFSSPPRLRRLSGNRETRIEANLFLRSKSWSDGKIALPYFAVVVIDQQVETNSLRPQLRRQADRGKGNPGEKCSSSPVQRQSGGASSRKGGSSAVFRRTDIIRFRLLSPDQFVDENCIFSREIICQETTFSI